MHVPCCVPFHPLCELTEYPVVGTALGPTLTVGMLTVGPVTLRSCFHQATDAHSLRSGPRTVVIVYLSLLWGLWRQPTLWPGPTPAVYAHKVYSS